MTPMMLVKVHEHEPAAAHRVESFPCTIGRSMKCQLRIDDLSVSGRHAQLEAVDGAFVLRDLGSTNGISWGGEKVRELHLTGNETVYFGDVRVELQILEVLPDTRLNKLPPDTLADLGPTTPAKIAAALVCGYAALVGLAVADYARYYWPPDRPTELAAQALVTWLVVAGVAFLVSLFCKLNAKRFHYHRIFNLMVGAYVAVKVFGAAHPTLVFNLHNVRAAGWLVHAGYAAIGSAGIFQLQRYAFRRWPRRQRTLVALAAGVVAAFLVETLSESRGFGERDRMAEVGLPLSDPALIRQNADDLVFDMALSVADIDQKRIRILEKLEAERDAE